MVQHNGVGLHGCLAQLRGDIAKRTHAGGRGLGDLAGEILVRDVAHLDAHALQLVRFLGRGAEVDVHAGAQGREDLAHHVAQVVVLTHAHAQAAEERRVAEDVRLRDQAGAVVHAAELVLPGQLVQFRGAPQPLDVLFGHGGVRAVGDLTQVLGDVGVDVHVLWLQPAIRPGAHLRDVVRAARLRARAHDRLLPAAERLTLDDGAGNAAVDIRVAHLDALHPVSDLVVVQGVDAAGQTEAGGVLPLDGLVQVLRVHDAQHRTEALVEVVPGARLHVVAYARGPQQAFIVKLLRLQQPLLTRLELGQAALELVTRRLAQAVHGGLDVLAVADLEGAHGIEKLVAQTLGLAGAADEDDERGRGTLLAGVAERGLVEVVDGQIRVGGRGDDERVLARGLRHEVHLRIPGAEKLARIGRAGEDDRVDLVVGDERLTGVALVGVDQLDQIAVQAELVEGLVDELDHELRTVDDLRGRLDDDGGTRRQRGHHAAGRDGDGEVPRRDHHGDLVRGELRAGLVDLAGAVAVVRAEVDGLGDLRVGLGDRLVGLPGGDGDEVIAVIGQLVADLFQHVRALRAGLSGPVAGQLLGLGHRGVDGGDVRDLFDGGLARVVGQRLERPLAVGLQRRVGVRLVVEAAGLLRLAAGTDLFLAVLVAARAGESVPAGVHGVAEERLLILQRGAAIVALFFRGEQGVQEVLGGGVLLKAAHQVAHGDVEVLHVDHRGVEDLAAGEEVAHRGLLGRGHALQHLGVEHVQHAALDAQVVGEGGGVEVVGGHADAQAARELLADHVVEQAVVVGVDLRLGDVWGDRPVVDLALDVLHGEVRALDQADLDRGAAVGHALLGKLCKVLDGLEGIRQVGLQHDAGLQVLEVRLADELLEQADGQVEVVVFLHVHVDEHVRAALDGLFVQRAQAILQSVDGTVDVPLVKLRND